jgi:hypothetical protein
MKTTILVILSMVLTVPSMHAQTGRSERQKLNTKNHVPVAEPAPPATLPKRGDFRTAPAVPSAGDAVFHKQKAMPDGSIIKQTYTVSTLRAGTPINNVRKTVADAKPQRSVINTSAPSRVPLGKEVCQTIQTQITASNLSDLNVDFSYSQQIANIYPGALYKFDDYYSGSWNAINYGRNPITLVSSVKNNRCSPTQTINDPGFANITKGVSNLFACFSDVNAQEGFRYTVYEVENQAEMAFKIGAAGHYLGISASNMFSSSSREKHKYLLIDATKEMFSISVQPSQNGLMADPNAATADMMYISNVTYGARVLACIELDAYDKEVADKVAGGAEFLVFGGSAEVETYLKDLNTTMKISFYAVGGNSSDAQIAYSFDGVKQMCNNIISNLTYKTSQPIRYQFKNRNNELVLSSSATDNFLSQSCTLERDMKVTANITGVHAINPSETDLEIYGQVWAQVFDNKGKEIMPDYGKDRLLDIKDNQHLNKNDLQHVDSEYNPNINATFTIPKDVYVGAKMIIYYWMMEYDGGSGDDFLGMRNGTIRKYNRNNIDYNVQEYYFKGGEKTIPFTGEFVDRDGESAIRIKTAITATPIPIR